MNAPIYNTKGEKAGTIELPEGIFGLRWNADLVHQVVMAMQGNARHSNAHTKGSGEVRGGGKKPWQQKGTGRARHGSSRSPIWKGGGVSHGPRSDKSYERKVNVKMKQKALLVSLSRKFKDGEIIFVDSLKMDAPKTAAAKLLLTALSKEFPKLNKERNAAFIALPESHEATRKSFRNIGSVTVAQMRNLNPVSVFTCKYLVIADPQAALEMLGKKVIADTEAK